MEHPYRLPVYSREKELRERMEAPRSLEADASMQVGELAQRSGKTVRALHLYEEMGLLRPHSRSKGGYRLYGEQALVRISFISKLQELGFSLTEVKTVVHDWEEAASAPHAMEMMRDLYRTKLEEAREQVRKYAALEKELEASLAYLDGCEVCEPESVLASCGACEHHAVNHEVPELVSGLRANPPKSAIKQEAPITKDPR